MQLRTRRSRALFVKMVLFMTAPETCHGLLPTRYSVARSLRFSTNLWAQTLQSASSTARIEPKDKDNQRQSESSSSTTRKRLGKSSFLYKQQAGGSSNGGGSQVTSPEDLRKLAQSHSGKSIGSSMYKKAWTRWLYLAVESIRDDLGQNLLQIDDEENGESVKEAFEKLFFDLGVAADVGTMPSFESPDARIGYSLEFFCRGRALAEFLLETPLPEHALSGGEAEAMYPHFWTKALRGSECPLLAASDSSETTVLDETNSYEIVSLGGGPGFDFVGFAMAAAFSFHTQSGSSTNNGSPAPHIHVTAMDYEEGWKDLVSAMDVSTRNILTPTDSDDLSQLPDMSCDWGGRCDITTSILKDPVNANCKKLLLGDEDQAAAKFWICQYCVAENAKALRASGYIFLKELVQEMPEGSMMLLTEVVPRLWPEMVRMLDREDLLPMVDVGFRKGYGGKQFLLQKRSSRRANDNVEEENPFASLGSRTRYQLDHFEKLASFHERKVDSGWKRQGRKANGSEYHEKQLRRKQEQTK